MEQWRSQDEQVTWAQHGHTQRVRNTHLLGDLGHTPAMKIFYIIHSEIASEAVFGHKINTILQTYLYARFMSARNLRSHMLITDL